MSTVPFISYLDPDGREWVLTDLALTEGIVCTAIDGIGGFPISFSSLPTLDGSATPQMYIPQPGQIIVGLYIETPHGGTENDYYELLDKVTQAFYNRRNRQPVPGYLIYGRPDGSRRKIATYTTNGLETAETWPTPCTILTLTLTTPDPYWYDDSVQEMFIQAYGRSGILPLLPIDIGNFAMGEAVIHNDGGADAWPTWRLTGPGRPVLSNKTTGRAFSFIQGIPSGRTVLVVTRPGYQVVVDEDNRDNWWGHLDDKDLWPLQAGDNYVDIGMENSGDDSSIHVMWNRRWVRA